MNMPNTGQAKTSILDLSLNALSTFLYAKGLPSGRARQVLRWIYMKQINRFEEMTDLTCSLRYELATNFRLERLHIAKKQISCDGSYKFLFKLFDNEQIESVLIPEKNHYTLCISSQVGCTRNCLFCLTGKDGLKRNLTLGEIVSQVRDIVKMLADAGDAKPLTNIVFMGMGEPLDNYNNVIQAITVLTDNNWGLRLAARNITVSTAGVVPRIYDLGRDAKVKLAISLNAVNDKIRNTLMPVNKEYPLAKLLKACQEYPLHKGQRITFEYILLQGTNDTSKDAVQLAELLKGIKAKINLIPFNEHAGVAFKRPGDETVRAFADLLCDKYKYTAMVRYSKGTDISAACGQLRG